MPQVIPIGKEAIRVLFLCSYDKKTLNVVEQAITKIREIYDPDFRKKLLPVLAKNLRIFEARSGEERYLILSEKWGNECGVSLFKNGKIINNFQCSSRECNEILRQIEESIRGLGEFRELTATTKVMELCRWSDLIAVIKQRGLGRGGELIELAMIICLYLFKGDSSLMQKTILLRKSRVRLSWMVKELTNLGKVKQETYKDLYSLVEELKQEIDRVTEIKRISQTGLSS
jgi:hypothetical protein